jgi:hypothetical protein
MAFTKILGPGIASDTNVQIGILTATNGIKGIGIYSGGYAIHSGIITALNFIGAGNTFIVHDNRIDISISGSGGGVGLGTPLSEDTDNPLNKIYYTDSILSIGQTVTIDVPNSTQVAYTQYVDLAIEEGADLIIADGDEFVADILGLSTEGMQSISGVGGRVRADTFTNKAGTGAPTFPSGVQVVGVATATSFSGDGSQLTGLSRTLTIGVRTGTAVTFNITGSSFNVNGRSGNISIGI